MAATAKKEFTQPSSFTFTPETLEKARAHMAKYPAGRQQSAVIPLLHLVQDQMHASGQSKWVPQAAIDYIAGLLNIAPMRVTEVASFYEMFHLSPVGQTHIEVCRTTPCWLRGSDDVMAACEKTLGIKCGETSGDGKFSLGEFECLGACANAPMVMVNGEDYYEDLNTERATKMCNDLKSGKKPQLGSSTGRLGSAPEGFKP